MMKTCSGPCKQQIESHVGKECGFCMKIRRWSYIICPGPCGRVVPPNIELNDCSQCKRHMYMETHKHCKKCNRVSIEKASNDTICEKCSICCRCKKDISELTSYIVCDDCKIYNFNCIVCNCKHAVNYLDYIKNPSEYDVCRKPPGQKNDCEWGKQKILINKKIMDIYGDFDDNYYIKLIITFERCQDRRRYSLSPAELSSGPPWPVEYEIIKYFHVPKIALSSCEIMRDLMSNFYEHTKRHYDLIKAYPDRPTPKDGLFVRKVKKYEVISTICSDDNYDSNFNVDTDITHFTDEFYFRGFAFLYVY